MAYKGTLWELVAGVCNLKKLRTELEQNEKSIFDSDNVQLVKQMSKGSTKGMLVYYTFFGK